eukprot:ctg_962.g381
MRTELRTLRQLVRAFAEGDDESLLWKAVDKVPYKLRRLLQHEGDAGWRRVRRAVRTFCTALAELLSRVLTEEARVRLLECAHRMVPYAVRLAASGKALVQAAVTVWNDAGAADPTRSAAQRVLEAVARQSQSGLVDRMLRAVCTGRVYGAEGAARVFAAADPNIAYRMAFLQVQELALALRRGRDHVATTVYAKRLRWWATVLSQVPALHPLGFPHGEVVLGWMRLFEGRDALRWRLQGADCLIEVMNAVKVYMPVAPLLLEMTGVKLPKEEEEALAYRLLQVAAAGWSIRRFRKWARRWCAASARDSHVPGSGEETDTGGCGERAAEAPGRGARVSGVARAATAGGRGGAKNSGETSGRKSR